MLSASGPPGEICIGVTRGSVRGTQSSCQGDVLGRLWMFFSWGDGGGEEESPGHVQHGCFFAGQHEFTEMVI